MKTNRRHFLKRILSMSAGAGLMMFLTYPKQAAASALEKIVKPIFMAAARYYAGRWMENTEKQLEKLEKWFGKDQKESDDKALAAIGTSTDARTVALKEIYDNELYMETQPHPSASCMRASVSSMSSSTKKSTLKSIQSSQLRLTKAGLNITSDNATDIDINVADQLAKMNTQDIVQGLNASEFLTAKGYTTPKHAETFKSVMVNNLYTQMILHVDLEQSPTLHGEQRTMLSRIGIVNNSLSYLFARRVRSSKLANALKDSATPTEEEILNRLADNTGKLSVVDLERYEVERNYLNKHWHDSIESIQSYTALNKEMAELHALSNKMDADLLELQERINLVDGTLSLIQIDEGHSNLNSEQVNV